MQIEYSVSIWNHTHHAAVGSLEEEIALIREHGFGVELWGSWRHEDDLYSEENRDRLRPVLGGMTVSLHSAFGRSWDRHKRQIDAAADWGGRVIVLHSSDLVAESGSELDVGLAREVVACAAERQVRIALENGQLPFLVNAIEKVEGLGICLDVGHVYLTPDPMSAFLDAIQERLIHLHLHDMLPPALVPPGATPDHYALGAGGIPEEDWGLLIKTLRRIDFEGIGVFEIRPRSPLQTALLGSAFMQRVLDRS
jgi:sugar phosphate isomerase/epimerase